MGNRKYCEICNIDMLKKNCARHLQCKPHDNKIRSIQEKNLEYLKNIPFYNEENINNASHNHINEELGKYFKIFDSNK
jgi:hypothetical protein